MYYDLPWCRPADANVELHMEGLGEALQGYELRKSGINIHFKSKYFLFIYKLRPD